jgi:uncharacterized glyoxalase superfamily protein PhnB
VILVGGLDDDFRAWMRARVPKLTEPKGRSWPYLSHSTSVMVAEVDAHYEHARAEGATTLTAPGNQPWGMRGYAALDLEGHHWGFGQQLREVEPEAWGAIRTGC